MKIYIQLKKSFLTLKDGCNIMISDILNLQLISLGCQNASWIICQRPKLPSKQFSVKYINISVILPNRYLKNTLIHTQKTYKNIDVYK